MKYEGTKLTRETLQIPANGGYGKRLRCVAAPTDLTHLIGQSGDSHGYGGSSAGGTNMHWEWRPNQGNGVRTNGSPDMAGVWFEMEDEPASPAWIPGELWGALFQFDQVGEVLERVREDELPEPPAPLPAVYDSSAFAADLDLAINYVRSTVLGEHEREFSQPVLADGVSMERALYLVSLSLIERQLGDKFEDYLNTVLEASRAQLIAKNQAYGNSALDPVRVFSKASLKEQLLVRLDDKVSRLRRGQAAGEDVAGDLLGYLLLVVIAERRERSGDGH